MSDREWNGSDVPLTGARPDSIRRANLRAALRVLQVRGPHTIAAIGDLTGMSRPTTRRALETLVEDGLAREIAATTERSSHRGRPASIFELAPESILVIGCDIGRHKTLAYAANLGGEIVASRRLANTGSSDRAERLASVHDAISSLLAELGTHRRRSVTELAIATPGAVDAAGTVVYNNSIPGWEGVNLVEWGQRTFEIHTTASTDMAMAAFAEKWQGAATAAQTMLYFHVGRRAGASGLIDGRPYLGHHRAAFQAGLWPDTPWRPDYLEVLSTLDPPASGWAELSQRAATNSNDRESLSQLAGELVDGLLPALITIDPELVVVGGGGTVDSELLITKIRERIQSLTRFAPEVVVSTLGDEAVALGSIRLALDAAETRLFSQLGAE